MDSADANPLASGELAAFVAALETGSVHDAGDALNLTQSAVTKRVQALERRLNATLFERGRFGMRPTAAGKLLYPEAKQALSALRRAEEAVREHEGAARRMITVAASHTVGEFLLPGWMADFRRDHDEARAQVEIVHSPGVLDAVRQGHVQIGFVEGTDDLTGFDTLVVHRDELVVVVRKGHAWSRKRRVTLKDLPSEPYYTRELESGTRAVATAALAAAGVELTPTMETASSQSVKRALNGGGFSILSRLAVETERQAGTLQVVPVEGLDLRRELHAVHDCRLPPKGLARAFWQWLASRSAI